MKIYSVPLLIAALLHSYASAQGKDTGSTQPPAQQTIQKEFRPRDYMQRFSAESALREMESYGSGTGAPLPYSDNSSGDNSNKPSKPNSRSRIVDRKFLFSFGIYSAAGWADIATAPDHKACELIPVVKNLVHDKRQLAGAEAAEQALVFTFMYMGKKWDRRAANGEKLNWFKRSMAWAYRTGLNPRGFTVGHAYGVYTNVSNRCHVR
jgi:hypothetical protein